MNLSALVMATTNNPSLPSHVFRGATVAGRPVITEQRAQALATPGRATLASRSLAAVVRPELPVGAGRPSVMNAALAKVVGSAPLIDAADELRKRIGLVGPERPAHSWLEKFGAAGSPAEALRNRMRVKAAAFNRGAPKDAPILIADVSPADIANGLATPDRGRWPAPPRVERVGDGMPILVSSGAPVTDAPLKSATLVGRSVGVAEAVPEAAAADSFERLTFLVAAAVIGFMVLKGARA